MNLHIPQANIESVLIFSTAHIREETNKALVERHSDLDDVLEYYSVDHGFFIPPHCHEDVKGLGYGELAHLMKIAESRGDTWLRLDADAPILDTLPTWEW